MRRIPALLLFAALLCLPCGAGLSAIADIDSIQALRDAELRRALAEAERAEWLARIPPSTVKPLAGRADTSHAGVAALMQSVELAMLLARELCAALLAQSRVVFYDAASSQGVVARAWSTMACSTWPTKRTVRTGNSSCLSSNMARRRAHPGRWRRWRLLRSRPSSGTPPMSRPSSRATWR